MIPQKESYSVPMTTELTDKFAAKAALIWFTGLSGAGKSTLSSRVQIELETSGLRTQLLDGDILRQGLCKDLGFSRADRSENIRRAGEVAKILVDGGTLTLAAFMSPMAQDREAVRQLIGAERFIEIYCKCSIEVCEARDIKGLYKKARLGQITHIIGRDEPYQEPEHPDLVVDTGLLSIEESVAKIMFLLQKIK